MCFMSVMWSYSLCQCHFHMLVSFLAILWQVSEIQGSPVSSCVGKSNTYINVSIKNNKCYTIILLILSNLLVILALHTGQLALFCLVLSKSFIIQYLVKKENTCCFWVYKNIKNLYFFNIMKSNITYLQNWWSHLVDTGAVIKSKLQVTESIV